MLRLWHAAGVTPPSISDSIEGLTRLIREPAALLLVATIDDHIIGSVIGGQDGWRGNIYRLAVTPEHQRRGLARAFGGGDKQRALRQGRHETLGPRGARTSMGDRFLGLDERPRLSPRSKIREVHSRSEGRWGAVETEESPPSA